MALIRLWGKSGVLRLPKNEHKEEFFKAPSISCSISFPVTPLLLENDVSKDMVCLMWNLVERWDVNYIYELSMDGIFFAGHWKDTAQTTNCAYFFFFFLVSSPAPAIFLLFRYFESHFAWYNRRFKIMWQIFSLIQGQNSCR